MVELTALQRAQMAADLRKSTLEARDEIDRMLAEAEGAGDTKGVTALRKLLRRNQKLIDDYGFDR